MPPRGKLLLLGDSLTQFGFEGWVKDLANRYQRRADVLNRGMSGYNTRWYLRYAEDYGIWEEDKSAVVLVTICFGANDAATLDQNVPLEEYKRNLETLIEKTGESYPEASILVITPPPVDEEQRTEYLRAQLGGDDDAYQTAKDSLAVRTNQNTSRYAEACLSVSASKGVPCLDLFSTFTENAGGGASPSVSDFFCDGLHFSARGHEVVSKALTEAIREHFPFLEVKPCPVTGQFNNSGSDCEGIPNSGPHHNAIWIRKDWREAFEKGTP